MELLGIAYMTFGALVMGRETIPAILEKTPNVLETDVEIKKENNYEKDNRKDNESAQCE